MLTHHPLTESHKREICSWQYEGKYAAYNLPPFEAMRENRSGFMNPDRAKNYIGFSMNGTLAGYVNMREEPAEIFIGVGVHPDFCNQGLGRQILQITADLARELYPKKPLYLIVRTWNRRAIQCYRHAGFRIDGEPFELTGKGSFCRMIRI